MFSRHPYAELPEVDRIRARCIEFMCVTFILITSILTVNALLQYGWSTRRVLGPAAIAYYCAIIALLRLRRSVFLSSLLLVSGVSLVNLAYILITGGPQSYALAIICAIPLAAAFLMNTRGLAIFTVVTLAMIAAIKVMAMHTGADFHVNMRIMITAIAIVSVATVGFGYAQIYKMQSKRLLDINAELQGERERAEAVSELKSRFLANMSHEIRTPMNAILGMTQILRTEDLSAKQLERVNIINESGDALMRILNDILDLSKVEAGKVEIHVTPFDLCDLMRSVEAAFALKADEKGLLFTITVDDGLPRLLVGDATRIRQVISNLVSNAIKFTDQGHVAVHVGADANAAEDADADAVTLAIRVEDTGAGLSEEALETLFSPFTQADQSVSRRHGGTGLGLAISRELAVLMGGDITVDSRPGAGSTFTARLVVERGSERRDAPRNASADGADASRLDGVCILAVEDQVVNRAVLQALLEPLGPTLVFAEHGLEAINTWAVRDFDVIVMDVQMPLMDGVEATREIRRLEAEAGRPRTPIIALTANVMAHQIHEYADAGMDAFVGKPINRLELVNALRAFVDDAAHAQAAAS